MESKSDDLENGLSSSSRGNLETGGNRESAIASSSATRDEPVDAVKPASTPPDGGWQAWMAAVFLLFFMGIISGRLTDAGYFHTTTILGAIFVVFGTFMTSLSNTYWQVLLSQGVCTGLGNGLLLTPMMTLITTYFRRRLPLVMGIAACGSTTGGLIYPSMARSLLPTIGFGWTMRAIGFIQLGTFVAALACGKPIPASKRSAPIVDWSVFREAEFTLYLVGAFLSFLGVFFPFFFLSSYAREKQGLSYTDSLNLTLVLNGIGFVARLLPSFIARYVGTMNVFTAFLFASALSILSVGGVQSLFLAVVTVINSDASKIGARLGIISAAVGIGALLGSPVSGVIISAGGGSYTGAQVFSGSTLVVGGMFVLASREVKRRQKHADFWMKL
ncbi:major facilitator superfamily domain-containing protein [Fusarium flagelliforme]|uniref:major facilitator superfamily domain-containing protein n=1 Tax=Fusarium flagelliforme TaxID=2675880 RepID=UPI001E8E97B6|nr:major facilitator superfamily domain-containing protein [Fusarium flagelliforme]KAH7174861.1 major facilitator superfamily domain-containing protein [Fusarium flagelliforme]